MPGGIDRHEVRRLMERGAQIVDVLPAGEHETSLIAGAINIPLGGLAERAATMLDRGRPGAP